MEKQLTDEEFENFVNGLVEKIDIEMDEPFDEAQNAMLEAEKTLLESLDEKQRVLYEDYQEKREVFYDIANTRILEVL